MDQVKNHPLGSEMVHAFGEEAFEVLEQVHQGSTVLLTYKLASVQLEGVHLFACVQYALLESGLGLGVVPEVAGVELRMDSEVLLDQVNICHGVVLQASQSFEQTMEQHNSIFGPVHAGVANDPDEREGLRPFQLLDGLQYLGVLHCVKSNSLENSLVGVSGLNR